MEGQRKYRLFKWIAVILWLLLIIGLILPTKFILDTIDGDLPTFEDLEDPEYDVASIVYDVKGTPFGKYYVAVSYTHLTLPTKA